uniref:Uncharacterized protein n=1 Tax=Plectus sambesii TaxID=2011161 RepID=A0A914WMM8_9BILA
MGQHAVNGSEGQPRSDLLKSMEPRTELADEENVLITSPFQSERAQTSDEPSATTNNFELSQTRKKIRQNNQKIQIMMLSAITFFMTVATVAIVWIIYLEFSEAAKENIVTAVRDVSEKDKASLEKLQYNYFCCGFLQSNNKPSTDDYLNCTQIEEVKTCSEELTGQLLQNAKSTVLLLLILIFWTFYTIAICMCCCDARRKFRRNSLSSEGNEHPASRELAVIQEHEMYRNCGVN